jgi:hypothetical protein
VHREVERLEELVEDRARLGRRRLALDHHVRTDQGAAVHDREPLSLERGQRLDKGKPGKVPLGALPGVRQLGNEHAQEHHADPQQCLTDFPT